MHDACELLAIDLDGTLLDSAGNVPAANRDALHAAHEAGLRIVLCTGRSFTETLAVLEQIGLDLDATVTIGGALLTSVATRTTLERTALDAATAGDLTRWFADRGYAVLWQFDPNHSGYDGCLIDGANRHDALQRWLDWTPCVIRRTDRPPDESDSPLRITIVDDPPPLERIAAALDEAFRGRIAFNLLRIDRCRFTLIEAFAPQVDKWAGVQKLCRRWRIDPQRTAAIGDDRNDLVLVQRAGLGVAVANADATVRAAASRIVASNDECGVAEWIRDLLHHRARVRR